MRQLQPHERAISLSEIARRLKGQTKYKKLITTIHRFQGLESIKTDLEHAQADIVRALELVVAQDSKPGKQDPVISALFVKALIFYARATTTSSEHRHGASSLWKKLSPEMQNMHSELMALRNDAIAHFGPGSDRPDQFWAEEELVLVMTSQGDPLLRTETKRANWRWRYLDGLSLAVHGLIDLLPDERKRRADDLFAAMKAFSDDPALMTIVHSSAFDPYQFYPSAASGDEFWNSLT